MALGACISGFRTSIRHVITINGTFLKAKYLGTLFVGVCKDNNNQIYPLCFGIGDLENDASWNGSLENCMKQSVMLMIFWWFKTAIVTLKKLYDKCFLMQAMVCAHITRRKTLKRGLRVWKSINYLMMLLIHTV